MKLLSLLLMLIAGSALAQQPPQADPRVATETVGALESILRLREKQLTVIQEDYEKKLKELKEKCGDRCQDGNKP